MLGFEKNEYALEQILVDDIVLDVIGVMLDAEREEVEYQILELCYPIVVYNEAHYKVVQIDIHMVWLICKARKCVYLLVVRLICKD